MRKFANEQQSADSRKRQTFFGVWWKMSGVGVANLVQLGRLIKFATLPIYNFCFSKYEFQD
jgi:hypothetical protein